jgi:hypothetical protein
MINAVGGSGHEQRALLETCTLWASQVLPNVIFIESQGSSFSTRKLHKRLHTHRTFDAQQVELNEKAPTCGAFAEPSDGLEPSTPSLPWRCSAN